MLRIALPLVLATVMTSPALAQPALMPRAPALLIHGNYCGPGNNAPLPPIDALDRACAHHDACTPNVGLPSQACNTRLQREAEAVSRDPRQPEDLRALAGFVATGAGMIPSDAGRVATAPVSAATTSALVPTAHRGRQGRHSRPVASEGVGY